VLPALALKEAFQQLWDNTSLALAGKCLDEWRRQTMRSRIEPMKKVARSLRNHNSFSTISALKKLLSSGSRRGPEQQGQSHHEKIQGFRTYRVLELAL